MSDDPKDVGEPDRSRIALGEDHEVRYWTQALGTSRERLEEAVGKVGASADKVRQYLSGVR